MATAALDREQGLHDMTKFFLARLEKDASTIPHFATDYPLLAGPSFPRQLKSNLSLLPFMFANATILSQITPNNPLIDTLKKEHIAEILLVLHYPFLPQMAKYWLTEHLTPAPVSGATGKSMLVGRITPE